MYVLTLTTAYKHIQCMPASRRTSDSKAYVNSFGSIRSCFPDAPGRSARGGNLPSPSFSPGLSVTGVGLSLAMDTCCSSSALLLGDMVLNNKQDVAAINDDRLDEDG